MKKIVIISIILAFPLFVNAAHKDWDIDYCNTDSIFINRRPIDACHIVKPGETLWDLAEMYYGNGFEWNRLQYYTKTMRPNIYPEDPRKLAIGSKLVVFRGWEVPGPYKPDSWGFDHKTGELYTIPQNRSKSIIYVDGEIYDEENRGILFFTVDKRTNNKIYAVSYSGGFTVVFNKERNPYASSGSNFRWMTFSPNGEYYAIRKSVKQDVPNPQFIVLSNKGNGPVYDFSDNLIWYDNDNLIYRAQNNDEWRVVVNNKDYKIFDYLENLRLEDGFIKFDARHKDGSWTKEEFSL